MFLLDKTKLNISISDHQINPVHVCFLFRACIVVDDRLYVIGGQEGDFMAKPGSPIFKCSRRNEVSPVSILVL